MGIDVDFRGGQIGPHQYEDADGYIMPVAPGTASRRIPIAEFPTGPAVGERLPEVVLRNHRNEVVDLHDDRNARPAVVVFYRSAVW